MMPETADAAAIEFEELQGDEETPEIELPPERRAVQTKAVDAEIASLHDKWKRGKLILQPDFQRHFVWDRAKTSRLIESALLSVPLPIIYLAEESDGKEYVIDGQQRLTSFFAFLDSQFPTGETFKLSGLKVLTELNRQGFGDIGEEQQDQIKYFQIRTITILKESDRNLKFEIFERLNTGSVPLNDMELRNCIYRGTYNALLRELAADPDFMQLLGISEPEKRMRDIELVLRFAAFYHETYLRYQKPVRTFLNNDMEKYRDLSAAEATKLRNAFKNAVQISKSLFGNNAFKRFYRGDSSNPDGRWEKNKFNYALYDVTMGVLFDRDKNQIHAALDSVREGFIDLISSNDEFVQTIEQSTSDPERVRRRFDLARAMLEGALKGHIKQPRCFSLSLKHEFFDANPTCNICGQRIQLLDDAAMDHLKQYWQGGQTIPENARLAHRYCNMARSRND